MSDQVTKDTAEKLNSISTSVCGAKWFQTTLHLFNGNTQSCHHVKSHRVPLKEIQSAPNHLHNSKEKRKVRQAMLEGVKVSECEYCWRVEKNGSHSDRHIKSSQDWARPSLQRETLESQLNEVVPTYLEVAFDNICNLKCMYCSPVYSSSWHAEVKKHGPFPTSRRFNNLTQFRIEESNPLSKDQAALYKQAFWKWWPELKGKLHHLRLTGGEPLLSADSWRLLEEIAQERQKNLIFSLNSNLMIPPTVFKKLLTTLDLVQKNVDKFILFCSIDSVGRKAEYLRNGLEEETFYRNLEAFLESSPAGTQVSFMITVSALSISGLPALFEKISQLKAKYPQHTIDFDTPHLNNPQHLSILILPSSFERYLEESIEVLTKNNFPMGHIAKVARILTLWRAERYRGTKRFRMRRDFKRMIEEHDRRRKTDFKNTFPEYVSFLNWITDPKWIPLF